MQAYRPAKAELNARRHEAVATFRDALKTPGFAANPVLAHLLNGPVSTHILGCIEAGLNVDCYTSTGKQHANVEYNGSKFDLAQFCTLWHIEGGRVEKVNVAYADGGGLKEVEILSLLPPRLFYEWMQEKAGQGVEMFSPVQYFLAEKAGLKNFGIAPTCLVLNVESTAGDNIPFNYCETAYIRGLNAFDYLMGKHITPAMVTPTHALEMWQDYVRGCYKIDL